MAPVVAIVAESGSDNLGDQAICKSLERILSPHCDVRFLYFGGPGPTRGFQHSIVNGVGAGRWFFRKLSSILPSKFKARIRWYLLGGKRKYRDHCLDVIQGSDFVIIGGGQLIKNNISLFCDRLRLINGVVNEVGVCYALLGVGVDWRMARLNWHLIDKVIVDAKCIFTRDESSLLRIKKFVTFDYEKSTVLPDLAFGLKNPFLCGSGGSRQIALAINVMDHAAFCSGARALAGLSFSSLVKTYCRIIKCHDKNGAAVRIFTSGATADLCEAQRMRSAIFERIGVLVQIFHPENLDELLSFLTDVRDVIAARMHVGILAYISGSNPVCLKWDDKVEGVWSTVGLDSRVIDCESLAGSLGADFLLGKLDSLKSPDYDSISALRNEVCRRVDREVRIWVGTNNGRDQAKL